jgi:hypothetical protein
MEPQGFMLSEAAIYSYKCQDVYPDIVSFAAAIPSHLRPLFLIPIAFESVTAASRVADGDQPSGSTPEGDLFSYQTFVTDDAQDTIPDSSPGSIFDIDGGDSVTHHQEYNFDENIQVPTDTSYMSDVDMTQYGDYPYRTKEKPVRKSSEATPAVAIVRLSMKPEYLETRAPKKIRENAKACSVDLVSYDKKNRVFSFSVDCGNSPKSVQASLSDIDHVALSCNCPFWRWNGPEFHAKGNSFMLGQPFGSASVPNVRDPDRKYWLCKHTYAVLRRLESFVAQVVSESWDESDEEVMAKVDEEWDRMEGVSHIPLEEAEEDDVDVEWDPADEEESEEEPEPDEEDESEPEEEELEEEEPEPEEEEPEPEEEEPEPEEPKEEEPEDYDYSQSGKPKK